MMQFCLIGVVLMVRRFISGVEASFIVKNFFIAMNSLKQVAGSGMNLLIVFMSLKITTIRISMAMVRLASLPLLLRELFLVGLSSITAVCSNWRAASMPYTTAVNIMKRVMSSPIITGALKKVILVMSHSTMRLHWSGRIVARDFICMTVIRCTVRNSVTKMAVMKPRAI